MGKFAKLTNSIVRAPLKFVRYLFLFPTIHRSNVPTGAVNEWGSMLSAFHRGNGLEKRLQTPTQRRHQKESSTENPLIQYFENYLTGPGIWKWTHYLDAYHWHFDRFRETELNLLEIGVYSGGSLTMWREYFGERCFVHGIDLEPACKSYETENVRIYIGDQESREFWAKFRDMVPEIQILIDDGGHTPEQQMVTLEEMLPYMPYGSIYVCEDIHGLANEFMAFAVGLVNQLNATAWIDDCNVTSSRTQQAIHSIHFYPFLCIVEKQMAFQPSLVGSKQGTEWQPFL